MGLFDNIRDIPIEEEDDNLDPTSDKTSGSIDFTDGATPYADSATTGNDNPRRRRGCRFLFWFLTIVIVAGAVAFYLRYLNPYTVGAREKVFVENVEKRGIIFKTYEVDVISPRAIADTAGAYQRQGSFSVASDSIGNMLQNLQNTGTLVEITYERFYATLPWRGASRSVITAVEIETE